MTKKVPPPPDGIPDKERTAPFSQSDVGFIMQTAQGLPHFLHVIVKQLLSTFPLSTKMCLSRSVVKPV